MYANKSDTSCLFYCNTIIIHKHNANTCHYRDLKPDNCLFLKDGTMKLADFGLARTYGTPKTRLSPQAITLWYKPPELLLGASEYSSAADIWSVGCIFAELLLRRPFLQGNQTDISQLDTIFQVFGTPTETNWPDHSSLRKSAFVLFCI